MAKDIETRKHLVTQHNQLTESSYKMTLIEKRILQLGMSKVNPMEFPSKDSPISFVITATEYAEKYGVSDKNVYRDIKAAGKLLRPRFVKFKENAGESKETNWIDSIHYFDKLGKIEITLTYGIQIRLQGIFEQFTQTDIDKIPKLSTFYSIRLYEALMQFKSTGWRKMSVEDLRFTLGVDDGTYKTITELKRNVLTPSLKELNKNSDIDVKCEEKKEGRKIVGFSFYFTVKPQQDLFDDADLNETDSEVDIVDSVVSE